VNTAFIRRLLTASQSLLVTMLSVSTTAARAEVFFPAESWTDKTLESQQVDFAKLEAAVRFL
jgi:predicted molibdopterin-dependent oxidoreductase YjgC